MTPGSTYGREYCQLPVEHNLPRMLYYSSLTCDILTLLVLQIEKLVLDHVFSDGCCIDREMYVYIGQKLHLGLYKGIALRLLLLTSSSLPWNTQ